MFPTIPRWMPSGLIFNRSKNEDTKLELMTIAFIKCHIGHYHKRTYHDVGLFGSVHGKHGRSSGDGHFVGSEGGLRSKSSTDSNKTKGEERLHVDGLDSDGTNGIKHFLWQICVMNLLCLMEEDADV